MLKRMSTCPKTAVVGASGFIGRCFLRKYRMRYPDCIGTGRDPIGRDIARFELSRPAIDHLKLAVSGHKDALILAGVTKMDVCERDKDQTRRINVEGTLDLVSRLVKEGIKPIYFSSDIIFDGRTGSYGEDALPQPLNEYARQKAEVEAGIKSICPRGHYLIVRVSKVFGLDKGDGSLLDAMAATLEEGRRLWAAYDQIFSPICMHDLVDIVSHLQGLDATGIFNVNPPETWSRYDLAVALAGALGLNPARVERIALGDLAEGFERPRNTTMKADKVLEETGFRFKATQNYIEVIAGNWRKYAAVEQD